ncbi:M96 mating-specific protein family [Phytophthora cinnamomi]|uniref:M96 mating-specific protein family n=1 Tax=Phytophthora cinnamomi TaxID=4785 RepID=UPI003559CC26|nr:M96 mating-specific protein family [Phytophthora cinnamomi]
MTDELDASAIQAILSFVEECAVESIASSGLSELTPSAAVFSSPSDAPPLEFLTVAAAPFVGSSDHPSGSTANENLAALSSPMAFTVPMGAQNCQPATRKRKPSRPRKSQANPNRIRNELRFELAFLREKAAQMEQELNSLKLKTQQDSTSISCRVKTPTVLIVPRGGSTQGLDAWKGIANRQRKRREDVERENTRLKLIVERQRKVAGDLADLLRKRVAECSHVKDPRAAEHHLVRVLDFTVLASNGLATMDTPTNDVHIREGVDGRYLEFFANKVMPFGLRDTAEAAWDHFKGAEKHCGNGGLYEKAAKKLDQPFTVIEEFTKELYSNSSRADIKVKQIVRRYVETERDIIVYEKISSGHARARAVNAAVLLAHLDRQRAWHLV